MREIAVSACKKGDILASDVLNENGVTLVVKDTVLNEYIKGRFIELGIESVRIYNLAGICEDSRISYKEFKSSYSYTVVQTKKILRDLAVGRPLEYQMISSISDIMLKGINENENIIRYLSEIHNTDEYTYSHSVNTAFYSMLIAKWLKLSDHEIKKAIQSGLLHDIGKSKIPNEILCKKGALTKEEYEIVKMHTIFGYQMVEDIKEIDHDIKSAILLHHERIDGSGYPFNTGPDPVNLYSRIVAVADVFDAMTSDRVYKKRVTPFEAFEMFQTIGIGKFDSTVLRTFLNNLAAHLIGSNVLLSTGETGEIVYIPLQKLYYPIIKVSSEYLHLAQENSIRIISMI